MSKVTVTLAIGPHEPPATIRTQVLENVIDVDFQLKRKVLQITQENPQAIKQFDFKAAATVIYTITAGESTVTIT